MVLQQVQQGSANNAGNPMPIWALIDSQAPTRAQARIAASETIKRQLYDLFGHIAKNK